MKIQINFHKFVLNTCVMKTKEYVSKRESGNEPIFNVCSKAHGSV